MKYEKNERLKTIILALLITVSLVQSGILWGFMQHGFPFNLFTTILSISTPVLNDKAIREKFFKPKRIIAIFDRNKHVKDDFPYSAYKIFVECDFVRAEFTDNIETLEHGFFKFTTLPELSVGRNTEEQIQICFKARREKTFEAIFD